MQTVVNSDSVTAFKSRLKTFLFSRASPPARGLRERCKLSQWGPGQRPGRNQFWCISKLVEGIKTVFTTKRDTVGSTNSRSVFVRLIFH